MDRRTLLIALGSLTAVSRAGTGQGNSQVLPTIAAAEVPLYPPLARAAKVEGIVHVKVETDGASVIGSHAEDGHRLLATAAEANARTWKFTKHEPSTFTVTYRYKIDGGVDPNNPVVKLQFPTEVQVTTAPLVISDPPAELHRSPRQ
jgi:hypothetical protein